MRTSSPESDYGDYLSNLKKKTVGNSSEFHIDGLSDLSLSEEIVLKPPKTQSKFLKNKINNEINKIDENINKTKIKSVKIDNSKKVDKNSKINKSENVLNQYKFNLSNSDNNLSSLINMIPEKINQNPIKSVKIDNSKQIDKNSKIKKTEIFLNQSKLSLSDSDINLSSSLSITPRPIKKTAVPKLQLEENRRRLSEDEESSFGRDGKRFFKKKDVKEKESNFVDVPSPRKSTLRSARTPPTNKKVTIADPISPLPINMYSSSDKSVISHSESVSADDSNFCGQKIMSLNDFEDGEEIIEENINEISQSDSYNHSFIGENIMSLGDLEAEELLKDAPSNKIEELKSEEDSQTEIKTLPSFTPRKLSRSSKDLSISENITVPATERLTARSSGSRQYSLEFEESVSKDKRSSISATKKSATSYSSDFTRENASSNSESTEPSIKKKRPKEKSSKSLKYNWNEKVSGEPFVPPGIGMQRVDPTPIAHYVVSPEALESVTAYSPCMILLTNMLRQQLQMTTSFIEAQRRLYDSTMSTIKPSYHYCTLNETKEFIRINKGKGLSMKEVQQLIEEDYQ